ncbi:MAG: putative motility protein [Dorea sp.]|nr:putative motility protein [Dorea sp.]
MDIPTLSMAMAEYNVSSSISLAVMSKILDTAEATGEVLTEMAASASVPGLGDNIDILA